MGTEVENHTEKYTFDWAGEEYREADMVGLTWLVRQGTTVVDLN